MINDICEISARRSPIGVGKSYIFVLRPFIARSITASLPIHMGSRWRYQCSRETPATRRHYCLSSPRSEASSVSTVSSWSATAAGSVSENLTHVCREVNERQFSGNRRVIWASRAIFDCAAEKFGLRKCRKPLHQSGSVFSAKLAVVPRQSKDLYARICLGKCRRTLHLLA